MLKKIHARWATRKGEILFSKRTNCECSKYLASLFLFLFDINKSEDGEREEKNYKTWQIPKEVRHFHLILFIHSYFIMCDVNTNQKEKLMINVVYVCERVRE